MLKGFISKQINPATGLLIPLLFLLQSCGGGGGNLIPGATGEEDDNIRDSYAWNKSGPHADILYDCALRIYEDSACTLQRLPLLGMEHPNPSVDDILDRLLVSDDWMGARFAELLEMYPSSLLTLFSGLTAIVIDDDIRPAFYSSKTGAIYLDPNYLWKTVAEKQTINRKEDYRSGFSDPLQFRAYSSYLDNSPYRMNYGSLDDNSTRTLAELVVINGRLLLHELAHVNDFLPRNSYVNIDRSQQVVQAIDSLKDQRISNQLQDFRSRSELLQGLGRVMYHGDTPTEQQRAITADEVSAEFMLDSVADMYAYSSQYEDLAMLFETAMMKKYWNMTYRISIATPSPNDDFCNTHIAWRAYNWLGDATVKASAMLVTDALLPEEDMDAFYNSLPAPEIATNSNWCSPVINGLSKPVLNSDIIPDGVIRYPEIHSD